MTLKTINGYRGTGEANQFESAIEARVQGGQAFMLENQVKQGGPSQKAPSL